MPRENKTEKPAGRQITNNYTMAVACRLTGIESHRIRRWEVGGLLSPLRSAGNQRLFSEEDIRLIIQIAGLEDEGVNMGGIKVILRMMRSQSE